MACILYLVRGLPLVMSRLHLWTFFSVQTVANLIERRLFETKESKWVKLSPCCLFGLGSQDQTRLWSTLKVVWLVRFVTDQWLIVFLLDRQASTGEIPANRGHSGISAGQRGRAWAADRGRGDDYCSWKATAGGLTTSYQQVGAQNKTKITFLCRFICLPSSLIVLSPSRLDSAENQVDETIFLLESYVKSTTTG